MPLVASQLGLSCNWCDVIQYYMTWNSNGTEEWQYVTTGDNMCRKTRQWYCRRRQYVPWTSRDDNMCRERPNIYIFAGDNICPATIYATTAAAYCLGLRVTAKRNSYTVFAVTVTAVTSGRLTCHCGSDWLPGGMGSRRSSFRHLLSLRRRPNHWADWLTDWNFCSVFSVLHFVTYQLVWHLGCSHGDSCDSVTPSVSTNAGSKRRRTHSVEQYETVSH